MIEQNRSEFGKCNILKWHDAGYKGKGAKVVVLDSSHKPYPISKVVDPFEDNISSYGHKSQVAQVLREVAPDAEIVVFSWFKDRKNEIVDWIKNHQQEIDAVNCSFNTNIQTEVFEMLENVDIPIIISSGNDYESVVGNGADLPWTISVGAWEEYRDKRAVYSNYGDSLDIVSYTNIYIRTTSETNTRLFNGTSCAAPMVSGMLAIYNGWLKENGLKKLSREEARGFVLGNTIDKEIEGFDVYSGHGLFILPKEIPDLKPITEAEEKEPEKTPEEEGIMPNFKDTQNHWAKDYIDFVADQGLMKGYEVGQPGPEDDLFRPDATITRAEVASVLARMTGYVGKK